MKTVLALDTSTDVASLALREGSRLIWEKEIPSQRSHSVALFPALQEASQQVDRIDRIAVGLGPGSFAGIRIAIAGALGLQVAWECELVGIPSVLGLAAPSASFIALGDARRGAWYFSRIERGECVEGPCLLEDDCALQKALCAALPHFANRLQTEGGNIVSAGSNGEMADLILTTDASARRWGAQLQNPRAKFLAELAAMDRGILQRVDLEPLYLREPHITSPKGTSPAERPPAGSSNSQERR
jgi:tRNA threonylcarbamoyladenosine biosynthesis protein TsaB